MSGSTPASLIPVKPAAPPWGAGHNLPPINPPGGGGPTPSYPILTEEIGYPPSPLSSTGGAAGRGGSIGGRASLGPIVTKALQDVLGWKINSSDAKGFLGALNQSFQLKTIEGAVVSTWTPRSYAVQTDLNGGVTGAQASIYTMGKTLLDQILPLLDGLYPLAPTSDSLDVAAIKQLAVSQLTNLVTEIGYLGGPRVMRVHQYFQMLFGVHLKIKQGPPISLGIDKRKPPPQSALASLNPWPPVADHQYWTDPDLVLGSLGDLRDQLGLAETIGTSYINTVSDEQNVTNFRIIVDYANSLLNAWRNSIQFFAGTSTQFLGTQLVIISRQLGVITETVNEVRFVLDSVFIGPAQRETMQIVFQGLTAPPPASAAKVDALPPICLEDLLLWIENFVGGEAQETITNGGKFGLGEDFIQMIDQLCTQAYGLYLYAQSQPGTAINTGRVQQSLQKLAAQLWDLYTFAAPVSVAYLPAQI